VRPPRAFIETLGRVGVGSPAARHDRGRRLRPARRRLPRLDIETAPYPGLATDLQPPTSVLLTQATGVSHVHETIFEDRLEWLARSAGWAPTSRCRPHHATIHGRPARRRRGRDRRPARRRLADPGRPGRRGTTTIHGAHHVHRGYENIERKFLDSGASIERRAEGTQTPPHEDRHRPRHRQRPRLRQGQGHRHHRASVVAVATTTGSSRWARRRAR
jgi:hypothetical protein